MMLPEKDEYGVKPLGVSWSRVYEFDKCQQSVIFKMQGKGDTVKDGRRFVHGTLADRAMRKWLEQDEPQLPGQMDSYVDELWDELVTHSDEYKIAWKGDPREDQERVRSIAKTVVNNIEPFLIARVLPYDYHPELRFKLPMQIPDSRGFGRTIILNGGCDIVVRESPEKLSIYDLKATTNEHYVHQGIMPQLIFYQIAMSKLLGFEYENIRAAFLTPACKTQYYELDVGSEDRRHLMTRIIRFANFVWDNEPPACAANDSVCFGCPMKRICPKWADVLSETQNDGKARISLVGTANNRQQAKNDAK